MLSQTIGFIGGGQMARALAAGMVNAQLTEGSRILVSDPADASAELFLRDVTGARRVASNAEVAAGSDVVILAVKPQQIAGVLGEIKTKLRATAVVVSVAAGIRLAALGAGLNAAHIVRVMPNTPCLIGQGATAYCLGPSATAADGELVQRILASVGQAFQVDEKLMDAVTGLSGSGPAFVYVMIEALADGGVRMGLPRELALALAAQTVHGAAGMVLTTGEHPAVLKDRVASPGGTTIAGLQALEACAVRAGLIAAVEAAALRSAQLG